MGSRSPTMLLTGLLCGLFVWLPLQKQVIA
ncbi:hypothetical protein QFZ84_001710 [Pseudomonas fluorescens]